VYWYIPSNLLQTTTALPVACAFKTDEQYEKLQCKYNSSNAHSSICLHDWIAEFVEHLQNESGQRAISVVRTLGCPK
jgi:hypothetical protein